MAAPTSRATLLSYCKRQRGDGVIDINISTDQEQDAIDNALQFYQDYHYDAIERTYVQHQITADDKTNKYLSVSDAITGIVNIFPFSSSSTTNLFDIRYQLRLTDLYDLTDVNLSRYGMIQSRLGDIDKMLVGAHPFDYNRHMDRIYIHMDWTNDIKVDEYLILECYRILDPETYKQIYNDRWLKRYTTSLIKKQWGLNLIKYDGMTLPGGLTYSGSTILDAATEEISTLEEEIHLTFELPLNFIVG